MKQNILTMKWTAGIAALALTVLLGKVSASMNVPGAVTMLNTTGVAIHGEPNIAQPISWEPDHVGTLEYVITYTGYVYRYGYSYKYGYSTYSWYHTHNATTTTTAQTSFNLSLPTPTTITLYTVSVAARSAAGQGEAVEMNITYAGPGSPVNVQTHNVTCNSITVTWEAPVNTGGLELLGYRIEENTTDFSREVGADETKQIVIPDLMHSNLYIRVSATNSIASTPSRSIMIKANGYVGMMTATSPSSTEIEVNITTPQTYTCSAREMDAEGYTHINTTSDGIGLFQGLKSNTKYRINCTGVDNVCIIANLATTRIGVPGAPTINSRNPRKTVTCQRIRIGWTPPNNTGGDEIRSYTVTYYISGAEETRQNSRRPQSGYARSAYLYRLVPSTYYTVLVRASNSEQTGEAANTSVRTDSRGKGKILEANIKATSVTLYHLLRKDVDYRCNVTTETSTDQFIITGGEGNTLSGLSADTTYTVNCVAYRDVAEYCLEANKTFRTLPDVITMLRTTGVAIHGEPYITQPIAWERPPGHMSILEYNITYAKYTYSYGYSPKHGYYRYSWHNHSTTTATATQTSFNLTLATPTTNTDLHVSVAARSDAGQGEAVQMNLRYTNAYRPVNIQTHNVTCNSITVIWEAPVNTGGLELLGYRIEENTTDFSREVGADETKQIVIPDLVQSTNYRIRVMAVNSISTSNPRDATINQRTAAKDEGELIEANIKATSVTLYHLLGKDVDYRCNVLTETSTDQFNITGGVRNTLSGLSADTTHTVNCVAYRGGVEYCLEATTTFRTSPVATVTDATSTSVDYYLEFGLSYNCTLLGKDNKVTATHKNVDLEKRQTFHGLTPGQNYSIRCSNRYRVFSVNTTFTTLEAPASEPMNLEGTAASSSQIRLTWQQPDYPNGVITSYVITYNEVQVDTNTASLGYTMTGLQPFTTYNISVASRNGAGVGEESREIGVKTRPGVPGAPTIARNISTTCQSLQISWTPPANTGGDEIMYYTVTYYVSGAVKNYINHTVYDIVVNAALVTLDELTPNTEYTVLVRASNSEQTGEAANTSVRTDSRDSISQRIIPFSSTGIIVAITPPPLQNIIGKAYTYSLSFVPNHLRVSPYNTSTTFQIFNGLQANTEYKVTSLVYRNGKGLCYEGMATGTTLPDTPPSRVRNLIVTRVTSTTIELRWERPEMTNGPITSYLIYYNGVQEDTSNVSLEYNLTGLQPFTTYNIGVAAKNGAGVGEESPAEITATTLEGVPGKVLKLRTVGVAVRGEPYITQPIAWERPPGHMSILEYVITISNTKTSQIAEALTNQTSFNLSLPTPRDCIDYNVSVAARSAVGQGEAASITVKYGGPDSPVNVQTLNITCNSITVTWEAPVNTGGLELLGYRIEENTTSFVKEIGPHDVKEAFISNLKQNTYYTINVSAINSIAAIPDRTAVRTQAKDSIQVKMHPFFTTSPVLIVVITPPQVGDGVTYNCSLALSRSHPAAASTYHTSSENGLFISSLRANTEYIVICTVSKGEQELCYEGIATGRTPS